MTGPEQHAATVREGLKHRQRGTGSTNNTKKYLAALDELVALARDTADELAHLKSEYHFDMDRGDHLVYRGEWERFDRWQRAVASGAAEAVDFVGAEQLAADRVNAAEARADELQRELARAAVENQSLRSALDGHEPSVWAERMAATVGASESLIRERERADELQREREAAVAGAMEYRREREQARREADQLRAALEEIARIDSPFGHSHGVFREIARAALAGVQAEEQA